MGQDGVGVLTPGARLLVGAAEALAGASQPAQLGVHHWLLALVERHAGMAEDLTAGLDAAALRRYLLERLRAGDPGAPLSADDARTRGAQRAAARGKTETAERDLAAVILTAAGYTVVAAGAPTAGRAAAGGGSAAVAGNAVAEAVPASGYRPRNTRPTPTIEHYGRDLTREAQDGALTPIVGRADEIQLVIETLCRRTKRNPVLIGPAGVGKTAIVEGLAQRIVAGDIPEVLRGTRLLALLPSLVVAGAAAYGDLQTRMNAILSEASQDGVVLFIDEVHQVIGAGGAPGTADMASLLKPALARGELACIAATTDDEYRRFIEPDAALERRFQPVRVQELTPEQTLEVLRVLRDDLGRLRGVTVGDEVLAWLVDFAGQYLRNRYFPDKAVDLLEQCVAYAVTQDRRAVEDADARAVAERLIGVPLELERRLAALRDRVSGEALLDDEDLQALVNRLQVTMRGMDVRPARPNAVLLLAGEAAASSEALAEAIATALFGAANREITLDLGRFVHPADVAMLVGAPPGYIGYSDALPLHRLTQTPWCVLRLEGVDAAHPQVRAVLTQGIAHGFITDARGKRLYLSDTVVLLTASSPAEMPRPVGFMRDEMPAERPTTLDVAGLLGAELAAQVDRVCATAARTAPMRRRWVEERLLAELADRYRKQGLELRWDETFLRWLMERVATAANSRDWERLMDEQIGPLLVPHLSAAGVGKPRVVRITWRDDGMHVEPHTTPEGGR
ncbi:MAG: AAA family ATPase [Armatimonadota bacterium]|nr:AAA family ATPase [Armatimonadota bacterium]MDR7420879.1 AAA family ATPase [Armatimonadota bacterium]MDR7456636.1 AAA family ATPase [Armatimonadota bacterium]MDR7495554.1 AAA family ATPase [Armatimonadota bacterium]